MNMEEDSDLDKFGTPEKKKKLRGESCKKVLHRQQKYRLGWETQFKGWLKPVQGEPYKAMCNPCKKQFVADISVIKQHSLGKKHLQNVKIINPTQKSIQNAMSFQNKEDPVVKSINKAEIKLAGFLAEHNLSFNTADHLTKLLKNCFHDSKIAEGLNLGRTKATNIVKHVLGKCHSEDIADYLKTHKFSVLIDESTDVGSIKTMAICVRYFDEQSGAVETRFWQLVQVFSNSNPNEANVGATGEMLYNKMIESFVTMDIPFENIVGFASDGCNTMFGSKNSVCSRLESNFPGIRLQKCICHSLHLCASEACKVLPRRCEDLARNVYNFFKSSAKRQAQFAEFQDFCSAEPHKMLRPSQTRWLSLNSVVKRIVEQWCPLQLFFTSQWMEHRVEASEHIFNALNDPSVRLFYSFLEWVLPKFVSLNEYFQNEKVVITAIDSKMRDTYDELLKAYMEPVMVNEDDLASIDPSDNAKFKKLENMYLGIGVMQKIDSLGIEEKKDFLFRCRQFLITSCKEIKKRYDFNDPVLGKIHIFNQNVKIKPESIYPIMKELPRLTDLKNVNQVQSIDDEWRRLVTSSRNDDIPENVRNIQEIDKYWFAVGNIQDLAEVHQFKYVADFVLNVLILPHSNATCERIFSKVNLIKTNIRNKLYTETVNGLILSSQCVNSQKCYAFSPSEKMLSMMTSKNLYTNINNKIGNVCAAAEDTDDDFELLFDSEDS